MVQYTCSMIYTVAHRLCERGAFETATSQGGLTRGCVPVHYVNVVVRGAFETRRVKVVYQYTM